MKHLVLVKLTTKQKRALHKLKRKIKCVAPHQMLREVEIKFTKTINSTKNQTFNISAKI